MKYLVVKNYEKFQHYRDRLPPWIKLYNTLLDDYAFIELPESSRIHLVLIWLVASRHENRIPYDLKYLARAIHAKSRINIPRLVDAGFLTIVEHDASNDASAPLASGDQSRSGESAEDASAALAETGEDASTHARPRARERESTRAGEDRETTHTDGANAEAEAALRAAMGPAMEAVDRFLATRPYRSRANWYPELLRIIGPAMKATPADLAGACTDALIVDPPVATPHALRAFVQKQVQVRTTPAVVKLPTSGRATGAGVDPVAEAAWQATLALLPKWQLRQVTTETFAEMSPPMRAAISEIGGLQQLSATPADRRVWVKKDFLAAYQRAAQTQPEKQSA